MTLMRAAAVSVAVHLSVFALVGTPGTTMEVPTRQPELMVWCTLVEKPAPTTAMAVAAEVQREPKPKRVLPAAAGQVTPSPPVASAALSEPEPVSVPVAAPVAAPAAVAEPALTAAVASPAPAFTAPVAITPPAMLARSSLPVPVSAPPAPASPGDGGGMVTVSELRYRSAPPPDYPALARRRGYEGTVRVQVEVDVRGRVKAASLVQSSGYAVLDAEALRAVSEWTFAPVVVDGIPRAALGVVPVRFVLR